MQEAFEKLKGMDIFLFKSYLEETSWGSFNGFWVILNELLVNIPFFFLDLVVGFFSLMIRVLEKVDVYGTYKTYVYQASKSIWQGFLGTDKGGVAQGSLVALLLAILGFYLFYQFAFGRGNFSKKVLQVLLVIVLGFSWFGTVSNTAGGLYLLDTVDSLADTATSKLSNISVSYGKDENDKDQRLKIGDSIADSYIAETAYKAYVFVHTGDETGEYKNNQTGKKEKFDDSKVLGKAENGEFKAVSNSDRYEYLNMGDGANEDKEKNRWVSAVFDYIPVKMFYVLFKIAEAIVIAIPIILIQILNILAQSLVLIMILLFPCALLVSFIPKMQDILFGVFKVMFGGLLFPSMSSLLILVIFYLEKVVENALTGGFGDAMKDNTSLTTFRSLFFLMMAVVAKTVIYVLLWKYKGELIQLLLGSRARLAVTNAAGQVKRAGSGTKELFTHQLPEKARSTFEGVQRSRDFFLAGAGLGAGAVMNTGRRFTSLFSGGTGQPSFVEEQQSVSPEAPHEPMEEAISEEESMANSPIVEEMDKTDLPRGVKEVQSPFLTEQTNKKWTEQNQEEFEERRQNRSSWRQKRKINRLEKRLEDYQEDEAMYRAQGSNAFIRNYRKTMKKDDKLKSNIRRREDMLEKLARLRGEIK